MKTKEAESYFWHTRFAWFPTCIDGRWIWLREFEAKTDYYRPYLEIRRLIAVK